MQHCFHVSVCHTAKSDLSPFSVNYRVSQILSKTLFEKRLFLRNKGEHTSINSSFIFFIIKPIYGIRKGANVLYLDALVSNISINNALSCAKLFMLYKT